MRIIEVNQCFFDEEQLRKSHGFQELDSVGKEAFVNHIHFDEENFKNEAQRKIDGWVNDMTKNWPKRFFKIYRHEDENEISIRFHLVREIEVDWCEPCAEVEIIEIRT